MSWWRDAAVAGGLLLTLAVLAWLTGEPVVFPSLGPTAYALAVAVLVGVDAAVRNVAPAQSSAALAD